MPSQTIVWRRTLCIRVARPAIRCSLTPISHDLRRPTLWKGLDETCHKYSSRECRALPKSFQGHGVKGQGHTTVLRRRHTSAVHRRTRSWRVSLSPPQPLLLSLSIMYHMCWRSTGPQMAPPSGSSTYYLDTADLLWHFLSMSEKREYAIAAYLALCRIFRIF